MAQEFLSRTGYRPVQTADLTSASISDFTEAAQDAVGQELTDTATIDLTYNDALAQITADLKNTTVVAGTYGTTISVAQFTVDAQGRLTFAGNVAIDDFLSGTYFIDTGNTKTIPIYKQMIVRGGSLTMLGNLVIAGQLYVED